MLKFVAAALLLVAFADAVSIKNCRSSLPVQLSVTKFPNPLYIRKGQKIVFSGKAVIKTNIPDKVRINVKIQKKVFFWVTVPCMKGFGSCTYDIGCADLQKGGYTGPCPVGPGTHALKDFHITLPDVNIPSFLANGKYYLKAEIRDGYTGKELACGSMYLNIRT